MTASRHAASEVNSGAALYCLDQFANLDTTNAWDVRVGTWTASGTAVATVGASSENSRPWGTSKAMMVTRNLPDLTGVRAKVTVTFPDVPGVNVMYAGIVFGYTSDTHYWVYLVKCGREGYATDNFYLYEVTGGNWTVRATSTNWSGLIEPGGSLTLNALQQGQYLGDYVGNLGAGYYGDTVNAGAIGLIASVSNIAFDEFQVERIDWPSPATPTWQVYGGGLTIDTTAGQASLGGTGQPAAGLAVRDGTWLGDFEAEGTICSYIGGIAFHVRDRQNYYLVGPLGLSAQVWKVVNGQQTAVAGGFVPGLATFGAFHQWYIQVVGTSIDVWVKPSGGSWYHPVLATGNGANILTDLPAGLVGLAADGGGVGYATVCPYLRLGTDSNGDHDLADAGEAWLSEEFSSADLSVSLTYDDAGNLTDDGLRRYTYDAWNKLVKVQRHMADGTAASSWPVIATYGYDGLGRRVQKMVKSHAGDLQRTEYHRYAGWQLLQIDDDLTQAQKQFVWGKRYIDEGIAMYNASYDGETVTWTRYEYLQDANYNVVCLRRASDGASERYEYDPYGVCRIYKGYDPSTGEESKTVLGESLFGNPIRYGGYFHDDETGLCHVRYRMYDPKMQRWLQREPRAVPALRSKPSGQYKDGADLYLYAKGHPTKGVDPSGLMILLPPFIPDARCENAWPTVVQQNGKLFGANVCYNGKSIRCNYYDKILPRPADPSGAIGYDWAVRCVSVHEYIHTKQPMEACDCKGIHVQKHANFPHQADRNECEAAWAERSCLMRGRAECENTADPPECKDAIDTSGPAHK